MGVPASLCQETGVTSHDGAGSALKLLYFFQREQRNTTAVLLMVTEYCSKLHIAVAAYKRRKLLPKLVPLCLFSVSETHQAASETPYFQRGTDNTARHGLSAIHLQNIVQVFSRIQTGDKNDARLSLLWYRKKFQAITVPNKHSKKLKFFHSP